MATRSTTVLTNFNGGELDKRLYGRFDIAKYPNSSKKLINFQPLVEGSITRILGTRFVNETKNNGVVRIIPFQFGTEQAYQIEAGDMYFRFYKDRGRIESPPGTPVEIATPYTLADLEELRFCQDKDVLYLVHPNYAPRKLIRASHTSWSLATYSATDGPYLDENVTTTTLQPNAVSGNVTITASTPLWAATDVGRYVRIKHIVSDVVTWGYAQITGYVSPTVVNATVKTDFSAFSASTSWRLGAWSDTLGWPRLATFHQKRLFFAASKTLPQTLWSTVSGNYESFSPTSKLKPSNTIDDLIQDDSALTLTINNDTVNAIAWLSSGKELTVGTVGGEFTITTGAQNEFLTPGNVTIQNQTNVGSYLNHSAIRIGGSTIFIQKARRRLYETAYNFETDSNLAPDLSLYAHHLLRKKIKSIVYQPQPYSTIWAIRDDGVLLGFTYIRDQQVSSWFQRVLGGKNAKVLSASVIPGDGQDELWLVVERTINGSTKRYIEYVEYEFVEDDITSKEYGLFVDSGLTFNGWNSDPSKTLTLSGAGPWTAGQTKTMTAIGHTPFSNGDIGKVYKFRKLGVVDLSLSVEIVSYTSSTVVGVKLSQNIPAALQNSAVDWWGRAVTQISGASHLEGETVQILADGATHPDKIVGSGMVSLDRPAVVVNLGLGYISYLESLSIEPGGSDGPSLGRKKAIQEVVLKLTESLGGDFGYGGIYRNDPFEEMQFRTALMPMDQGPPLFTGDIPVSKPSGTNSTLTIIVKQEFPLPFTLSAVSFRVTVQDG